MKPEYWFFLLVCGFAIILAFVALLLVPSIASVRIRHLDLQTLEMRALAVPDEATSNNESGRRLYVLSHDEFFESLANIRVAALAHGLEVTAFSASEAIRFGLDINEITVMAQLTGGFDEAIEYVNYLAGGVYNIRYLSLVNTYAASFDVWISIFHEF